LDITTAEWFVGGMVDMSLKYAGNGRSYGVIVDPSGEDKLFYIELSPGGNVSAVGVFDNGLDAIQDTEDDECLSFAEVDQLISTASQMIKTCNNED
jgi:hypothetical protein